MADKLRETLLDALRQGLADPAEQRLFKSGKLPGLFGSRVGVAGEAAALALRERLLEVTRTESKGKIHVDWVRPTPKAVQFVHEHESAAAALEELLTLLRTSQEGVPVWLAEIRRQIHSVLTRINEESQRWTHRLDTLGARVEAALRRAEVGTVHATNGAGTTAAWAADALAHLDRRRDGSGAARCPLPELFAALHSLHPDLSLSAFHDELRRLRDRQALQLLPFPGPLETIPQPEYALLDGASTLYFAAR
jgi:hypothetical protein